MTREKRHACQQRRTPTGGMDGSRGSSRTRTVRLSPWRIRAPKVAASYFDLVRDPKTGEITFWTKEDDTEGTPWRQVDKIRLGLEASTVGNKTTTNAQFNGYVSP